jgi:hypothetical protein
MWKTMKPLETVYWLRLGFGVLAAFLSISFLVIAGAINTNLAFNPSVETGNAGTTAPQNWSSSGNGTEWSVNYARTGSRSLRIDVSNASAEWRGGVGRICGGSVYHVNGFFFGRVIAGQFLLTIRWFSDSQKLALLGEDNLTLGNYTQWLPQEGDFTAPSGAESCEIVFRAVGGSGYLYGDDFEVRQTEPVQSFFNSASIALIVYIASYYLLKSKFGTKVAKPQKILTAGIGIYLLAWIVVWALLYSIMAGV